jgi:hypothetical protein
MPHITDNPVLELMSVTRQGTVSGLIEGYDYHVLSTRVTASRSTVIPKRDIRIRRAHDETSIMACGREAHELVEKKIASVLTSSVLEK